MNLTIKNTAYYTIGSLIRALTSFVLLPVFANLLGPAEFGMLNLMTTYSAILVVFMTLATERSIYRLLFDYSTAEGKTRFLSTVFWIINGVSLCTLALVFFFGRNVLSFFEKEDLFNLVLITTFYTYVSAIIQYFQVIYQVEQKGKTFLIVSLMMLLLYNGLALFALYYYEKSVYSILFASFIAYALTLPVAYWHSRHHIKLLFDKSIISPLVKYVGPVFFMIVFAWLLSFSDRMFIAKYYKLEDVGYYSLAYKMTTVVSLLMHSVMQAYNPLFYNYVNTHTKEQSLEKFIPLNNTISVCCVFFCLFLAVISKPIIQIFFHEEYYNSVAYVYILLMAFIFSQQVGLFTVMIHQMKKTVGVSLISVVCGSMSVALNLFLLPLFGPIMAAINTFIVSLLSFSLQYVLARRSYYITYAWIPTIAGVCLLLICYVLNNYVENTWLLTGVVSVVIVCVCGIMLKLRLMDAPYMSIFIDKLIAKLKSYV